MSNGRVRAPGHNRTNLEAAALGEVQEIEVTLPRMIRDAEEDGIGRRSEKQTYRLANTDLRPVWSKRMTW
jgi:hypothetical protein